MVVFLSFLVIALTVVVALAIAAASSAPYLPRVVDDLPDVTTVLKPKAHAQAAPLGLSPPTVSTAALTSPPLIFAAGLQ